MKNRFQGKFSDLQRKNGPQLQTKRTSKRATSDVVKKAKEKKWRALGKYLANLRLRSGLSQGQVARLLKPIKIGPQFISNIERGVCSPPEDMLREFMVIYKVNPSAFIKELLRAEKDRLKATFRSRREA